MGRELFQRSRMVVRSLSSKGMSSSDFAVSVKNKESKLNLYLKIYEQLSKFLLKFIQYYRSINFSERLVTVLYQFIYVP